MRALVDEFALTPDVLDRSCYSDPVLCDFVLRQLKKPLIEEALVWGLRDGEWQKFIVDNRQRWDPRGKELFKKLVKQGRIRSVPSASRDGADTDAAWCREALESPLRDDLCGVLVSHAMKQHFDAVESVASVEKLEAAQWWNDRDSSTDVRRRTEDYLRLLRPIFRQANSLMFIDRYIDPEKPNYTEFRKLVAVALGYGRKPLIEIHRIQWKNTREGGRIYPSVEEWKRSFDAFLGEAVSEHKTRIKVLIWKDFHDRYLISDIVGISLQNGFDVDGKECLWYRLSRKQRDEQQRKFDPAANGRNLVGRFFIGDAG